LHITTSVFWARKWIAGGKSGIFDSEPIELSPTSSLTIWSERFRNEDEKRCRGLQIDAPGNTLLVAPTNTKAY
jgi:hypothetical protein